MERNSTFKITKTRLAARAWERLPGVAHAFSTRHVSQEVVQLHGGMGMTEELKISHTFRRLTTIGQRFGDADHHLQRYAGLG